MPASPFFVSAGASGALLPFLTPTLLKLYASQPERCATPAVAGLYDLAQGLAGTPQLEVRAGLG